MVSTLVIGLDGATFTVLDPLMSSGVMPVLRHLTETGVRAPLRTVMPPLTPPGWTSLMTGKRPGQHGVFDFFQKDTPESRYFHYANSQDIRSATIWSLASDHGKRVISLNFPVMFPPPAVNGCVVPGGWMPWRQLRLGCHPPGLFERLRELPSFNPKELSLDMTLEAKAIEDCPEEEYAEWVELHIRREERWFEVSRRLMEVEPADLVGVIFDGVDKLQHLCWRFIDPAFLPERPSPWEQEIIDLCERYFRRLDDMIGELVHLAGPDTTVLFVSDHGFGPTSDIFYINAWLEQQGYLRWANGDTVRSVTSPEIGFAHMARHVFELDWEHTVAYAATPSSQGIHIVQQVPGTDRAMSPETYLRIRAELADQLREIRHPLSGRPLVTELWTREEAFAGPYEELAPDLSVILDGGAVISILRSDDIIRQRREPKGHHRWEGIFIGAGPELRSGVALDEMSILDIAPLVLYSLGVPIPLDMAGVFPEPAVTASATSDRAPVWSAPADPKPASGTQPEVPDFDQEAEAIIVSRLRALGYVE